MTANPVAEMGAMQNNGRHRRTVSYCMQTRLLVAALECSYVVDHMEINDFLKSNCIELEPPQSINQTSINRPSSECD